MAATGQRRAGRRGERRRLARSTEFDRVFREGRSHASRHLVLHVFARAEAAGELGETRSSPGEPTPRLGVSVGRRVGGAVERNRVKRLLREAFWALSPELAPTHDFVLVARSEASELARRQGEPGFERELRELVSGAGLTR